MRFFKSRNQSTVAFPPWEKEDVPTNNEALNSDNKEIKSTVIETQPTVGCKGESTMSNPLISLSESELRDLCRHQIDAFENWCRRLIGSCDGINQSIEGYSECKIANYVGLFEKELSTMYVHLNTLKDIEYSALSQIILRYFSHLQIRIIELADGFCFEILS